MGEGEHPTPIPLMPIFDEVPTDPTKSTKTIVHSSQLASASALAPRGVLFNISRSPHRSGNPKLNFYEAWFQHEGGTLRSSLAFHIMDARRAVIDYVNTVTGVDHSEALAEELDKYNWQDKKSDPS